MYNNNKRSSMCSSFIHVPRWMTLNFPSGFSLKRENKNDPKTTYYSPTQFNVLL